MLESNQRVSTVAMRVDCLRPTSIDVRLIGEGIILRMGTQTMKSHQGESVQSIAQASAVYDVHRVRKSKEENHIGVRPEPLSLLSEATRWLLR